MEPASALVDPAVLQALHEFRMPDEPDPADEVAQVFLAVTPGRLAELRHAVHHGTAADVKRLAHQVRGSCAAVGAIAMHAVATDIETTTTVSTLPSLVDSLETLFESTRPLLLPIDQR